MKGNKGPVTLVLLVLASVLLAACGGGGAAPANVTVLIKEAGCASGTTYCLEPTEISVTSGQDVTLSVKNVGANQHTFVLVDVAGANTLDLAAGKAGEVKFTAPAPGEYKFYCDVPGHEQLGMVGKLIVK